MNALRLVLIVAFFAMLALVGKSLKDNMEKACINRSVQINAVLEF